MPITVWPEGVRPREKLLERGPGALSDAELLALFLHTGVRGKTAVDLARERAGIDPLVAAFSRDTWREPPALLVVDGRVAWVGRADDAPGVEDAATEVVDAGGRAALPGFVDSHTHLVFGGDRADEFEARMAGVPYAAGGIRRTVAATRAVSDDELRTRLAGFVAELHAQGTTTFEVK